MFPKSVSAKYQEIISETLVQSLAEARPGRIGELAEGQQAPGKPVVHVALVLFEWELLE